VPFLGQQHPAAAVLEHVANPLLGVFRIDRHIGSARFQYPQNADDHFQRSIHQEPDQAVGLHPRLAQAPRQLVGFAVQLPVRQFSPFVHHRHRVGPQLRLRLEQLVDAPVPRILRGRRVKLFQQYPLLLRPQNLDPANTLLRCLHRRPDRTLVVSCQSSHILFAERFSVVRELDRQLAAGGHDQTQIIVGLFPVAHPAQPQVSAAFLDRLAAALDRIVLEHKQVIDRDRFPSLLQLRQRQYPHRFAFQGLLLPPGQRLPKRRPARIPAAHRHGVDEQPDRVLNSRAVRCAPRDHVAVHDVVRSLVLLQDHRPGHLHKRALRHAPPSRKVADLAGQLLSQWQPMLAGFIPSVHRCSPSGQRGFSMAGKVFRPKPPHGRQILLPEPSRVVRKRPGFPQPRRLSLVQAAVYAEQLMGQGGEAPAVHDHVMPHHHQTVPALAQLRHRYPKQAAFAQVELVRVLLPHRLPPFLRGCGAAGVIAIDQPALPLLVDHLPQSTAGPIHKVGAQSLVARDNLRQTLLEDPQIKGPLQFQRQLDRIGPVCLRVIVMKVDSPLQRRRPADVIDLACFPQAADFLLA